VHACDGEPARMGRDDDLAVGFNCFGLIHC
jgi:hypothetical protein